jgi:hypothetical protein
MHSLATISSFVTVAKHELVTVSAMKAQAATLCVLVMLQWPVANAVFDCQGAYQQRERSRSKTVLHEQFYKYDKRAVKYWHMYGARARATLCMQDTAPTQPNPQHLTALPS